MTLVGTKKKRIQVYVNDATYGQIEGYALDQGVSISEAAGQLLSTHMVSVGPPPKPSDYVTRDEVKRLMELMESKYQAYCEVISMQNTKTFAELTNHAVDKMKLLEGLKSNSKE